MFAIKQAIPKGIISLWYGNIASIPSGWTLCDGNNGTPDLRDRFIVGAKQDEGGVAKTNVSGALTQAGGSKNHTHVFTGVVHGHTLVEGPGMPRGTAAQFLVAGATATGTNSTVNNLDPYYALAYIMKL